VIYLRRCLAWASVATVCVVGSVAPAHAQDSDPAADLFRQGRDAITAKDFTLACAKFAESQRLEARVGTLINLALCEEELSRLASARQYWEEATALGRATSDSRVGYAAERFAAIDRRVPRLVVRIAGGAPPGTVVHRDDVELGSESLGTPLPLDPGKHTIVAVAPHHADGTAVVVELAEGDSKDIEVTPGPSLPEPLPPPTTTAVAPPPPEGSGNRSLMWYGAVATGGLGIGALGIGTYFGIEAINGKSGSPGICTGDVCDTQGTTVRKKAVQDGNVSTVAFVAGGVLMAAGVVLWIVKPSASAGGTALGVVPGVDGRSAFASVAGVL
jgi:hypothetical protein